MRVTLLFGAVSTLGLMPGFALRKRTVGFPITASLFKSCCEVFELTDSHRSGTMPATPFLGQGALLPWETGVQSRSPT